MYMLLTDVEIVNYANECQSHFDSKIIRALVKNESGNNTTAIAKVGDSKFKQTIDGNVAKATFESLLIDKSSFSVGLMQINNVNFLKYGITRENAFDVCKNIKTGAAILNDCLVSAEKSYPNDQYDDQLNKAFSCYYSGNFSRGFKQDSQLSITTSYVERINKLLGNNLNHKNIGLYDNVKWYAFNTINKSETHEKQSNKTFFF